MKVVIPIESRFTLSHGRPASHHLSYDRFWTRYLDVFDEVVVVGRLFRKEDSSANPVEGPGVRFVPLPEYNGFVEFLKKRSQIKRCIASIDGERTYILRLPGLLGGLMSRSLVREERPFGVEVVGDPFDVFAPGAYKHPLREAFRWAGWWALSRQCRKAVACAYVSEHALQRRYPPCSNAFSTHYSSVELGDDAFVDKPRVFGKCGDATLRLVAVGTMEQRYKGFDILIAAVERCVSRGVPLSLTLLGDGRYRSDLQAQVDKAGLSDIITFLGKVPAGEEVRTALDMSDVFVTPSRQEGLPRALIEAMARGLPSLGSTVGGIPELLQRDELVKPNDINGLAELIESVAGDNERMNAMSSRNLDKAKEYHRVLLQQRRRQLFEVVKEAQQKFATRRKHSV